MTSPADQVTTVIMTRNRRDEAVRAVQAATGAVVVVDNGSDDGTAEALRTLGRPALDVVALPRNVGAHARDVGVARACTPLVAFADDDSWWDGDSLAAAATLFTAHPRLGLLAARLQVRDDGRLDPVCQEMAAAPWGTAGDLPGPDVLGFVACATVVRKAAFEQCGGFGDVVFFGGEEERLALDLAAAGWGLSYVEDVVARHHPSALRPPSAERQASQEFNAVLTAVMRRPWQVVRNRRQRVSGPHPDGRSVAARRLARALSGRRRLPADLERRARLVDPPFPSVAAG